MSTLSGQESRLAQKRANFRQSSNRHLLQHPSDLFQKANFEFPKLEMSLGPILIPNLNQNRHFNLCHLVKRSIMVRAKYLDQARYFIVIDL